MAGWFQDVPCLSMELRIINSLRMQCQGRRQNVPLGVVGQGKCPGKCSAKMSLRYAAMVSDVDGLGTIRCFHPGGPPASR